MQTCGQRRCVVVCCTGGVSLPPPSPHQLRTRWPCRGTPPASGHSPSSPSDRSSTRPARQPEPEPRGPAVSGWEEAPAAAAARRAAREEPAVAMRLRPLAARPWRGEVVVAAAAAASKGPSPW